MRSKGRSRPMSATLTTKRKSARDRPASSKERVGDWGRESGIDRPRCSRPVGAASRSPRLPARARGPVLQRNEGAASEPTLSRHSTQLPLASSAGGRRAHDAAALALDHSSCCRRPRRRRPAWHTLQTPSLCCCSRHPSAFRAAIDATPVSVASTRACVRNGGRGVWRAPQ